MSVRQRHRLLGLVALILMATGCATAVTYSGPRLPREQVALMPRQTAFIQLPLWSIVVSVKEIDGRALSATETKIEFLPGPHVVRLVWIRSGPWWAQLFTTFRAGPETINFQAETGHSYRLRGQKIEGGSWTGWIEDEATGAVVGGTKPEP